MNCKPGDVARIIDAPGTRRVGYVDYFIRVTEPMAEMPGSWRYEGPLLVCRCGCGYSISSFSDEVLRPICDPGDGAVDETLLMVRIPEFDTV
ncbi:hypothetical protein SAMN05518669_103376 [Variovorax sp. YR634]|uniref:hypothetical protein n=1 Tax=Variovorax sp. YR634 TaxID=1884385 RepID=UPI00089884F2|nr:hypothetical protein [Variovorax sp. YR634]SDX13736.1 hypothetical protein SAMN05518669_103376 [Variovorax sp. YR634]